MIKKYIYAMSFLMLVTCKNDDNVDCSVVTCPVRSVNIFFVDKTTQDNIILRDKLIKDNFSIIDKEKKTIKFSINESTGLLFAENTDIKDTYDIYINSEKITTLSFDTSAPKTNNCCDNGDLINVTVTGKAFSLEENIISIKL